MFGFSFQKIIFTIAAVTAVWYAFKWIGRYQEQRSVGAKKAAPKSTTARSAPDEDDVEEMVKCAVCSDYVSKGAAVNCGRTGCPYPG